MVNDLNKSGGQDRERISLNEDHEVRDCAKKLESVRFFPD
jgi:hypothetical protein